MNAPVVCTQSVLDVVLPVFHVPDLDLSVCIVSQTVDVQSIVRRYSRVVSALQTINTKCVVSNNLW